MKKETDIEENLAKLFEAYLEIYSGNFKEKIHPKIKPKEQLERVNRIIKEKTGRGIYAWKDRFFPKTKYKSFYEFREKYVLPKLVERLSDRSDQQKYEQALRVYNNVNPFNISNLFNAIVDFADTFKRRPTQKSGERETPNKEDMAAIAQHYFGCTWSNVENYLKKHPITNPKNTKETFNTLGKFIDGYVIPNLASPEQQQTIDHLKPIY